MSSDRVGASARLREATRALVLKSVALVLEFGEHLPEPEQAHALAEVAERRVAGRRQRAILKAAAGALVFVSISAAILVIPIDYELLHDFGLPGVFLITLIATGGLVVPAPYLAVIFKAGGTLDPLQVALVAGVASAIGELTGYLLGFSGRELVGSRRWQRAVERWMQRHGFITIWLFSLIPNPLFDAAGIAAGAVRYPVWKFVSACFTGKTLRFLAIALLGSRF